MDLSPAARLSGFDERAAELRVGEGGEQAAGGQGYDRQGSVHVFPDRVRGEPKTVASIVLQSPTGSKTRSVSSNASLPPKTPPPAGVEGGVDSKRVNGLEPSTFSLGS